MKEVPADLRAALDRAADRIGRQSATIVLQGLLHSYRKLQCIDGRLSRETVEAIDLFARRQGVDQLVEMYETRLRERFPTEFVETAFEELTVAAPESVETNDEAEPTVMRKPKRRRKG